MGHYYITDAFSSWDILNPNFPDELPEPNTKIYVAIVDGPVGKDSTKVFAEPYIIEYRGEEWLAVWYRQLWKDLGPNATIIWVKIPPTPKLPKKWRVVGPVVCDDAKCDYYDNGYCIEHKEPCPKAIVHREFSNRDY